MKSIFSEIMQLHFDVWNARFLMTEKLQQFVYQS